MEEIATIWHRPYIRNMQEVEKHFGASYLLSTEDKHGNEFDLLYQEKPDWSQGHNHLLVVYHKNLHLHVASAFHLEGLCIDFVEGGISFVNRGYHYSRGRHDYNDFVEEKGHGFIDGGRDYTRADRDIIMRAHIIDNNIFYTNENGRAVSRNAFENKLYTAKG